MHDPGRYTLSRNPTDRARIKEYLAFIAEHTRKGTCASIQTLAHAVIWAASMDGLDDVETRYIADFRRHVPSIPTLLATGQSDVFTLGLSMYVSSLGPGNRTSPSPDHVTVSALMRHRRKHCPKLALALDAMWDKFSRVTQPREDTDTSMLMCGALYITRAIQSLCAYEPPPGMEATLARFLSAWRGTYTTRPHDDVTVFFVFLLVDAHTQWGHRPLDADTRASLAPESDFVRMWFSKIGATRNSKLPTGPHATIELVILASILLRDGGGVSASQLDELRKQVAEAWSERRARARHEDQPWLLHMAINLLYAARCDVGTEEPPCPHRKKAGVKRRRWGERPGYGDRPKRRYAEDVVRRPPGNRKRAYDAIRRSSGKPKRTYDARHRPSAKVHDHVPPDSDEEESEVEEEEEEESEAEESESEGEEEEEEEESESEAEDEDEPVPL